MIRSLAAAAFATLALAFATPAAAQDAAATKLYDLGYPTDPQLAVQRWRSDNRLAGTGPLTDEERITLLAQASPEFVAAVVGNPFTGMGLALRHSKRDEAEREAIRSCKAQGGGPGCVSPIVLRAEQCAVISGYTIKVDRRPMYRVTTAISTDISLAGERSMEGCQTGASHPQMCRLLVKLCGDGRAFEIEGADKTADATALR